jgi:hypothetical protein
MPLIEPGLDYFDIRHPVLLQGMGLRIPLLEHDLLKMETTRRRGSGLLLYLGQTQTDGVAMATTTAKKRPTSYQPPLVQCHADPGYHILTNELFPMAAAMLTSHQGSCAITTSSMSLVAAAAAGLLWTV